MCCQTATFVSAAMVLYISFEQANLNVQGGALLEICTTTADARHHHTLLWRSTPCLISMVQSRTADKQGLSTPALQCFSGPALLKGDTISTASLLTDMSRGFQCSFVLAFLLNLVSSPDAWGAAWVAAVGTWGPSWAMPWGMPSSPGAC